MKSKILVFILSSSLFGCGQSFEKSMNDLMSQDNSQIDSEQGLDPADLINGDPNKEPNLKVTGGNPSDPNQLQVNSNPNKSTYAMPYMGDFWATAPSGDLHKIGIAPRTMVHFANVEKFTLTRARYNSRDPFSSVYVGRSNNDITFAPLSEPDIYNPTGVGLRGLDWVDYQAIGANGSFFTDQIYFRPPTLEEKKSIISLYKKKNPGWRLFVYPKDFSTDEKVMISMSDGAGLLITEATKVQAMNAGHLAISETFVGDVLASSLTGTNFLKIYSGRVIRKTTNGEIPSGGLEPFVKPPYPN